jgi:hypothetical protein
MEKDNLNTKYINRLVYYVPRSALIFSFLQLIFFRKFTTGFLFGMALGAGYCHKDLSLAIGKTFNFKKLKEDVEDLLSTTLPKKN